MVSRLRDTLLLVGDENSDRAKLRDAFQSGYDLLEAENVHQALMFMKQNGSCIAAILADIPLEDGDGVRALAEGARTESRDEIPFIVLVDPLGTGKREEFAFSLGATDVEKKPFTAVSIRRRVEIILDLYLHKWNLEKLVSEQSVAIRNTNQVMVDALSAIIEHRSTESGNHVLRIRRFTKIVLDEVARNCPEYGLTEEISDIIAGAAALHDIGKISIPDAILNKPGRLTPEEFEIMKTHTTVGGDLIKNLTGMGDVEYLRYAYNISRYHHERWDGNGYPEGMEGDAIPICAQVVGIVDAFDALTTKRVYKPALPYDKAINMIINGECGVFSPKLVACFKNVRKDLMELANRYADGYSPKSDVITAPLSGPVWKKSRLNAMELTQIKYQTLLHHLNDTVVEMDIDEGVYHIVYNPNPDFEGIDASATLGEFMRNIFRFGDAAENERRVEKLDGYLRQEFFAKNARRKTFDMEIYSPLAAQYRPYEVTVLRLNTQNADQRLLVLVFHAADTAEQTVMSGTGAAADENCVVCMMNDSMPIAGGGAVLSLLTGYSAGEMGEIFGGNLAEMILPEDRDAATAEIREVLKSGTEGYAEFRLSRKAGPALWVADRFRVYRGEDGDEYICHRLEDNSRDKEIQANLEKINERNQILIDRSGDIVFEWDLDADIMVCSDRWEERFGYPPVSKNYSEQMGKATHFHPDDLMALRNTVTKLRTEGGSRKVEVRIANGDGKYLWNEIRATAVTDKNGAVERIFGLIKDTDELKRATLNLKEKAERDPLTKLLNKDSSQIFASEYLSQREEDSIAAMLILDLDNFKMINDTYGHLYGDAVLSQVGTTLKSLFRSHDIIGRIGGDEFIILMKDIPDETLVCERCETMLRGICDMMERTMPELGGSCSIGAAIVPDHGESYNELFKKADEALYIAKGAGKNQFKIYDPHDAVHDVVIASGGHGITSIDSDVRPGMANQSFLRYIFQTLYESRDLERSIGELLQHIGRQLNVSRAYIFENNENNTACSNTFEWCNDGISPEINSLQNVSYVTDIPGWPTVYDEQGVFYCTDVTQLEPQFRAILEPQGIKSMLQSAIMDNGVFRGYVGFDECSSNRMWTKEQTDLLTFLAELLAVFLLKKRSQDKLQEQTNNLRHVLDLQDDWIYVVDTETMELKFLNEKVKSLAPKAEENMICHKVFLGKRTKCGNCPVRMMEGTERCEAEIDNRKLGVKVVARADKIIWNGKEASLVTCREIQ